MLWGNEREQKGNSELLRKYSLKKDVSLYQNSENTKGGRNYDGQCDVTGVAIEVPQIKSYWT